MTKSTGDELWALMRTQAIQEAIALHMQKGLDFDSFLLGLHLALTDPVVGSWIAEAVDKDGESAARLRHLNEQLIAGLREKWEKPDHWD